jgi:probable rRNA maturation factor
MSNTNIIRNHEVPELSGISNAELEEIVRVVRQAGGKRAVSIVLTSDVEIRKLNLQFRSRDTPTNVLAFPQPEGSDELGDVIISTDTVMREATEMGIAAKEHLFHMLIHGVLHLEGFDHQDDAEAEIMEALEREYLGKAKASLTVGLSAPGLK